MNWQPTHPAVKQLIQALRAETSEFYLVGGAVRDLLLSTQSDVKDFDFVVAEPAIPIAKRVADRLGWAFYVLDETREIARILFHGGGQTPYICDIARMRGETLEADLQARDFTINALALRWLPDGKTRLVDICNGRADLQQRILRRVSPSCLAEDAIRILRAPRFIAQLEMTLDSETEVQIMRLARSLQLVKAERIRDELWKALTTARPVHALQEMHRLGLLPHVLPELAGTNKIEQSPPHYLDAFLHTVKTVENAHRLRSWLQGKNHAGRASSDASATESRLFEALEPWRYRLRQLFLEPVAAMRSRADWLLWHALFHDVGKPVTQSYTDEAAVDTCESDEAGTVPDRSGTTDRSVDKQNRDDNVPVDIAARGSTTQPEKSRRRIRFLGHEDIGARLTAARLDELRFSRHEISLASRVVQAHMRPHHLHASFGKDTISRRAAYRFYRDVTLAPQKQMAGFDILLLALCDYPAIHQATPPPHWEEYLQRIGELFSFGFEQLDEANARHTPLVNGRMLMRHFNLKPGRHIGEVLEKLHEAQIAGEIHSVEEALDYAAAQLENRASITV